MRRSEPGERNLKSKRRSRINMDKKQPPLERGAHDPNYQMQYGCSRKTGQKAGGYFWNPPDYCESPRIEISEKTGDRWVMVYFCKQCPRYKTGTCPAKNTTTKVYEDGFVIDEPKTRGEVYEEGERNVRSRRRS